VPHVLRPAENSTGWDACSTLAPRLWIGSPSSRADTPILRHRVLFGCGYAALCLYGESLQAVELTYGKTIQEKEGGGQREIDTSHHKKRGCSRAAGVVPPRLVLGAAPDSVRHPGLYAGLESRICLG